MAALEAATQAAPILQYVMNGRIYPFAALRAVGPAHGEF